MTLLSILAILFFTIPTEYSKAYATASTDVGIWYSTWYAKQPAINTNWITNFGTGSSNQFIGDVDGDGKDDAVIFNSSNGSWQVALSNGNGFNSPSTWITGHGVGSDQQFLADVNGDGKQDAIVFFASTGDWYVSLSNGSSFLSYNHWASGVGIGASKLLLADVNGDGKADVVTFDRSTGTWTVCLSNGTSFGLPIQWTSGFGNGSDNQFVADVNADGKADAIYFVASTGTWYAANSSGSSFGFSYLWTDGHGTGSQSQLVSDGNGLGYASPFVFFNGDVNGDGKSGDWYGRLYNKYHNSLDNVDFVMNSGFGSGSDRVFQGNVTGDPYHWKASIAFYASTGTWQVERYHFFQQNLSDTWSAFNIKYLPLTHGSYQTYDSGDISVIDEHLADISSANIDYLLMDETNNLYVDDGYIYDRAVTVSSRINNWNSNPNNRILKYALAIGGIQFTNPTDPALLEFEAGESWNQFVNTTNGGTKNYYYLNGKPLLVVYCTPDQQLAWESWTGDKTNSNKFTIRWANSPSTAGTYGWEVRNGTLDNDEVMVVMPGWNNHNDPLVSRANGDYYSLSGWEKVMEKTPKPHTVVINSYNEYAEQTAVAVTNTDNLSATDEKWTDKSGTVDNYMYWNMTKNYINLLRNPSYQASTLFSKGQGWYGWSYNQWDGVGYSNMTWDNTNNYWIGSQPYSLIGSNWQHPDLNDSARTWTAPYSGTVRIQGTVQKQTSSGDGVIVKIIKNSTVIWGPQTITTTTGMSHDFTTTVNAGDSIYFIVNKNGDNSYDTTNWDPIIAYQ
ncbi:MAG: hypothetical protein A2189_01195 [Paenibacillus sp. RIFOXYA1_FULL_44_5]|nr:MAG: hypothetical protein A2189_01195 [Paenibacillus sp. RIFOXYA1_FULL_44_5]